MVTLNLNQIAVVGYGQAACSQVDTPILVTKIAEA
jgi:hypothetical protein